MEGYTLKERKLIHSGKIIKYYSDFLELPDGHEVEWDFIQHKGAAAVVPVDKNGNIIVVRQYRHAIEKYTIEIPAGGINPGEDPCESALRELEEETGYYSSNCEHLLDMFTTVAFCNEKIYIYVAHDLKQSKQNLDPDEYIKLETYSVDELVKLILNGTIEDSKTISAILAYKEKYL